MESDKERAERAEEFTGALLSELLGNAYRVEHDNVDFDRFPRPSLRARARTWVRQRLQDAFRGSGYTLTPDWSARDRNALQALAPQLPALAKMYRRLGDDPSRKLLVKLLAYRVLGADRVRLPLGEDRIFTRKVEEVRTLALPGETIPVQLLDFRLSQFDIHSLGYPLTLFATAPGIVCTFGIRQYDYSLSHPPIRAERDDVVLDCGGCWGDTTLYFAAARPKKVYVFEFIPSNLSVLERNLRLNPTVTDGVVEIVPQPVWRDSHRTVFCTDRGPASRVSFEAMGSDEHVVKTICIDDLVREKNVERLDFIKMDIEGAELDALAGASASIRRFRPKLAISVYHRPTDITAIPELIDSFGLDYEMYLGHYTMHAEETVLFARPRARG